MSLTTDDFDEFYRFVGIDVPVTSLIDFLESAPRPHH